MPSAMPRPSCADSAATSRRIIGVWYSFVLMCLLKKTCGFEFSSLNQPMRLRSLLAAFLTSGIRDGGSTIVEPENRFGMRNGRLRTPYCGGGSA